jgi:TolB protein
MKYLLWFAIAIFAIISTGALLVLTAQDAVISIVGSGRPKMGIPDFRGAGEAQNLMGAFNQTLWDDVKGAALFDMVAKTTYPTFVPQQPSDFQTPAPSSPTASQPARSGGRLMSDWSSPPAQLNYLAFGYAAAQNGVLVLSGWLYDLSPNAANHQVLGKRYLGTVDDAGARKVAHQFAADIISLFGAKTNFGSHIYFASPRTGHKEIWVMEPDGRNQTQITHFNSISAFPAVAPDGSKIAFTSWAKVSPGIFVFSVDPVRDLRFYNQSASVNGTPSFTPDGKQVVYMSSAGGHCCRIFIANLDGTGLRPISSSNAIDTEPKINPKTGSDIVFVSGRSGPQQIYKMNMDGADVDRLTPGNGEASNPSWHPAGQKIAFAWTQGYATGNFNIFIMDVATRAYVQLTHGEGRNENPSWAPDGVHLCFMSTRSGRKEIWSMLADGTQPQQLTTQGVNETPIWGK